MRVCVRVHVCACVCVCGQCQTRSDVCGGGGYVYMLPVTVQGECACVWPVTNEVRCVGVGVASDGAR